MNRVLPEQGENMIFGSYKDSQNWQPDEAHGWKNWGFRSDQKFTFSHARNEYEMGMTSSGAKSHDAGHSFYLDSAQGVSVALYGAILNLEELAQSLALELNNQPRTGSAEVLFAAYRKYGREMFSKLNGNFVIVVQDPEKDRLWIARDHLGIESIFYHKKGDSFYFSTDLQQLANHPKLNASLNPTAALRYFLFNYNPGMDTFYTGIEKLRPGNVLCYENGKMESECYWYISFKNPFDKSIETYREELLELFRDSIKIRLDSDNFRTGAYLSGGMDSSTIVGLMRPMIKGPVHTFSFRCRGKSYDESHYARLMSEHYKTEHHEVPYESSDVHRITQVANLSMEPFSDIGIEVASYLLAEKASGVVDYVLTGDGGDELFAGHPVYLADRMADKFEKIPAFLRNPMTGMLQKLPDTNQKKSLVVKAKRFSYSASFPADLYSNRWRIYYMEKEMKQLLNPEWLNGLSVQEPLKEIRDIYHDADGDDYLSKTLYGDYHTVVGFYLRRMELVRSFGMEGRIPLLDHRLVDYTCRIPGEYKIDKSGATKAIFHKVMAGTLPDEIVFRKDKLGHSVPFKNWLRDTKDVKDLLSEYLSEDSLKKRNIFNPKYVRQMYDRHMSRADNNSHRLWAIMVFELWCRKNLDKQSIDMNTELQPA